MATLSELTTEIISAHCSGTSVSSEELVKNIQIVFNTLKALETGVSIPTVEPLATEPPATPVLTIKQAFKKDEVICMICGKSGLKTLKRHLQVAHDMNPNQYRKQFNIPSSQTLVAKNYSEQRKKDALDRGQGDILAKARAVRAAKKTAVPEMKTEAPAKMKKTTPVTTATKAD